MNESFLKIMSLMVNEWGRYGLSVLNEDEHNIRPEGGIAYTRCFDAVKRQLRTINPDVSLVGPEISGGCGYPSGQFDYLRYFLNRTHHDGGSAPEIASYRPGCRKCSDGTRCEE